MMCLQSLIYIFIICAVISPVPGELEVSDPSTGDSNKTESELVSNYNESDVAVDNNLLININESSEIIDDINGTVYGELIKEESENETKISNATIIEPNRSDPVYKNYNNCITDKIYGTVEIVNATRLMELLIIDPSPLNRTDNSTAKKDKSNPRTCLLVLFYSRWCVFSSQAAPHFNALPRFYPHIKAVAIDASKYQNFNMQFGIVGVPTLMFVYNGKPLVKFNETSYTLESFARFVTEYTGLKPNGSLYVTSADFGGPIPSTPSNETDYCLVLSWVFIAMCGIYFTLQSRWWKQFVELVQNTWRESNAQHEHTD
ncbi:thioredoxin domain-containing protein 15 [Microplitis demolitor]|uniref:thioredoxin domain-containing protein 15 n=1 Tax=Microplitis demolitor TaxID=69319 RepID=UPI0004CDB095|nr:thioredoxin domain-containing protein 15 [Microplitis demolitor]